MVVNLWYMQYVVASHFINPTPNIAIFRLSVVPNMLSTENDHCTLLITLNAWLFTAFHRQYCRWGEEFYRPSLTTIIIPRVNLVESQKYTQCGVGSLRQLSLLLSQPQTNTAGWHHPTFIHTVQLQSETFYLLDTVQGLHRWSIHLQRSSHEAR